LFQNPDKVAVSRLVGSRNDLQSQELNENSPIYELACAQFNDHTCNSGGLVSNHPLLISEKINPDLF
jgi:hypothetical protein